MQKSFFDLSITEHYPGIIKDYLKDNEKLRPFYKYRPEIPSFKKAIEEVAKTNFKRKLLGEVLKEQYTRSGLQPPDPRLLSDTKTFTICTGHQLCLFTGPLYFIYKIISTIKLAKELKINFPEYNFIPVYWMASEDHDFAEINHINLFGKKIEWDKKVAEGSSSQQCSTE